MPCKTCDGQDSRTSFTISKLPPISWGRGRRWGELPARRLTLVSPTGIRGPNSSIGWRCPDGLPRQLSVSASPTVTTPPQLTPAPLSSERSGSKGVVAPGRHEPKELFYCACRWANFRGQISPCDG